MPGGTGVQRRGGQAGWQAVLDAAAALQLHRRSLLAELERSRPPVDIRVVSGGPLLNEHLRRESGSWRHLLSIRPRTVAPELEYSLPNNRRLVDKGLTMTSVFDRLGTSDAALGLLAGETKGRYVLADAPVQMKVIDHRSVMLEGPGPDTCVMVVQRPATVELAVRYWAAVMVTSDPVPAADPAAGVLTERQQVVVRLLREGWTDERVAAALRVSVRTVRTDIAAVLESVGARSRFAAAWRLASTESDRGLGAPSDT
ncbi:response regulator transcription factor [Phycicoccus sp. CSK15P-2]|uniref:helix-turn-helix transcriptional regulator n=1 Tax=Phycicoccus sp. CSK15P-2 TaxID=2807627 RepID=UPI00194F5C2E|nr:helix-turn-helix domain-containing protein [Phycicoccus sp. CSK15P-2]MBM6404772.1 response regulator transcription factor [Phycicoccus sp. CSK15P-2]